MDCGSGVGGVGVVPAESMIPPTFHDGKSLSIVTLLTRFRGLNRKNTGRPFLSVFFFFFPGRFDFCFVGERMFKECPHPDEKQRLQLSRELGLAPRQIKFWFQNRRTQMKAQHERADNSALRAENDKIRCENIAIREALKNVICSSCAGPPVTEDSYFDDQKMRMENAQLTKENKWVDLFPTIVSIAKTIEVISPGMLGTHGGSLQLTYEELQVLSPLVPIREFYTL